MYTFAIRFILSKSSYLCHKDHHKYWAQQIQVALVGKVIWQHLEGRRADCNKVSTTKTKADLIKKLFDDIIDISRSKVDENFRSVPEEAAAAVR